MISNGVSLTWAEGQEPHLEIRERHNPKVLTTRFLCGTVGLAHLSELVSRSTYFLDSCEDAHCKCFIRDVENATVSTRWYEEVSETFLLVVSASQRSRIKGGGVLIKTVWGLHWKIEDEKRCWERHCHLHSKLVQRHEFEPMGSLEKKFKYLP